VINEVVAAPNANETDWVEFYNAGTADADISGWYFTDSDPTHVYTFAAGTTIPAGMYLVLSEGAAMSPTTFTFGLSPNGDEVNLFDDQDAAIDSTVWGDNQIDNPNSWARLPNGTGNFQVDATPTKGAANN
jgi:hypothetical protein